MGNSIDPETFNIYCNICTESVKLPPHLSNKWLENWEKTSDKQK